jgi:exopolysaccharide biosynthesis protein
VDGRHRDSRLALGMLRDGQLLFALTRVATPGGTFDVLPLGPTAPEMVALMGALGCRDAVLLDGGISGQMLARDAHGRTLRWPGLRHVPLALIAESR